MISLLTAKEHRNDSKHQRAVVPPDKADDIESAESE